jgi:hypothetical protein
MDDSNQKLILYKDGIYIDLFSHNYEIPNNFKLINLSDCLSDFEIIRMYSSCKENILVLKYLTGSIFKKHSHFKIDDNHVGDLILFPPIGLYSRFIGGDLNIYFNNREINFQSDSLLEWTAIFLPLEVPHDVSKIIEGIRYSFKFDLYKK